MNRILIILTVLLYSCTAQDKLNRLLKKHPELAKTTVIKEVRHDTLITKELHKDSVINNIYSRDTVYIHEKQLTVKYLYKGGDSAYLGGKVLPDTLIRIDTLRIPEKTLIQQVPRAKTGFENFCEWAVILMLVFLFGKYVGLPLAKYFIPKLPL